MHNHGNVVVSTVRNLEVGDSFAMEYIDHILSGKVKALVHTANELTPEQREYMQAKGLEIPKDDLDFVAGHGQVLIFGDFFDTMGYKIKHMYVSYGQMIAAFPKS